MKSNEILYSKGKNDECHTPAYAVAPILKYIPKGAVVWCPFDTADSWFVKMIEKQNQVMYSHIEDGRDFFEYEPENWDVIISNPPFTNKRKYFERALSFGKPLALIMSNTWLNDAAPVRVFMEKELQLLMFTKRIEFINIHGKPIGRPTFSSSYYCWNFLPKQIIMENINTNLSQTSLFK